MVARCFFLLATILGFTSGASIKRSFNKHKQHPLVVEPDIVGQTAGSTKECGKAKNCKTPLHIIETFAAEWKSLTLLYGLQTMKPIFHAGTAMAILGCRPKSESLSDFDIWDAGIGDNKEVKERLLELKELQIKNPKNPKNQNHDHHPACNKVPLDVRLDKVGGLIGFQILKENAGRIVDEYGESPTTPITHEYDISDGLGPFRVELKPESAGSDYKFWEKHPFPHIENFPYKKLSTETETLHKPTMITHKGVTFGVIHCKNLVHQKKVLARQSPSNRAYGLDEAEKIGKKKLAADLADIKCIENLIALKEKGPCDAKFIQNALDKNNFDQDGCFKGVNCTASSADDQDLDKLDSQIEESQRDEKIMNYWTEHDKSVVTAIDQLALKRSQENFDETPHGPTSGEHTDYNIFMDRVKKGNDQYHRKLRAPEKCPIHRNQHPPTKKRNQ